MAVKFNPFTANLDIVKDGLTTRKGSVNPDVAPGVPAAFGTLYLNTVTKVIWYKSTASDTGWLEIPSGVTSINSLIKPTQFISTGEDGTDFNVVSDDDTHTLNLPVADDTNTGKLSNTDWENFDDAATIADNLVTLSGMPENSTDYNTFTGSTLPDNKTSKELFQTLETVHEEVDENVDDLIQLSGMPENSKDYDIFTGSLFPSNLTGKELFQFIETALEGKTSAIFYRAGLEGNSDLTGSSTGNTYIDSVTSYVTGDFFKITSDGTITVSDGTFPVHKNDNLYINKDIANKTNIVLADLDHIDNTEAPDILRSGDLTSAQLFVGNASNVAQAQTISGDININNTGAASIQALAVKNAMIDTAAVDGNKIADESIDSQHYVDGSIDNEHYSNDSITGTKIRLSNNEYLKGRNQADDGNIEIVKVNASNELEFSKTPFTPSEAPNSDYKVANKKYVDDQLSGLTLDHSTKLTNLGNDDHTQYDRVSAISSITSNTVLDNTTLRNTKFNVSVSGSNTTIGLPAIATIPTGYRLTFIKITNDLIYNVILDPNASEEINGASTFTITRFQESITIINNGTSWDIISNYINPNTIPINSSGDLNEVSFLAANDQSTPVDITGLSFANASVRSFSGILSVSINADSNLYESFHLNGVQKGSNWSLGVMSEGDDSGIELSITNDGQVQYASTNLSGFVSNTMKFRAITTSV